MKTSRDSIENSMTESTEITWYLEGERGLTLKKTDIVAWPINCIQILTNLIGKKIGTVLTWIGQRRDDDFYNRKVRTNEPRKRDRAKFRENERNDKDVYNRKVRTNEPRKRDRAKVRENERNDKEDSFHSREQSDNGCYRISYEKDVGSRDSRHMERDEGVRNRYDAVEYYHIKRRKDEEYLRREHMDKEEIRHGYRENASWCRRERDEVLDQHKIDELQRSRDYPDDQYTKRNKHDALLMQEWGDRQRDREEWHRLKLSHEVPTLAERDEGTSSGRSVQGAKEKAWVGRFSAKDEHKLSEKITNLENQFDTMTN